MIPSAGTGNSFLVDGDFYRWHLTAANIEFELRSNVAHRLKLALLRTNALQRSISRGGLLLGRSYSRERPIFRVMEVEPCESGELHGALTILTRRLNASIERGVFPEELGSVLGFYRIATDDDFVFSDRDMDLARTCFHDPRKVFLLLNSSGAGTPAGSLFFWNEGELQPAALELHLAQGVPERTSVPGLLSLPGEELSGGGIRSKWYLKKSTFAVAAALSAGLFLAKALWDRPGAEPVTAPSPSPGSWAPLEANVTAVKDRLWLSWDIGSASLASARVGLVIIRDGDQRKELALDRTQLLKGGIFYKPDSPKVSFTLKIFDADFLESVSIQPNLPAGNSPPSSASPQIAELRAEKVIAQSGPASSPRAMPPAAAPIKPTPEPALSSEPIATNPVVTNDRADTPPPPRTVDSEPEERRIAAAKPVSPPPSSPIVPPSPAIESNPVALSPPAIVATVPSAPAATAPKVTPAPPPAVPAAPIVGPARIAPEPLKQARPVVPASMRSLISRHLIIKVTLGIDANGKVIRAEVPSTNGSLEASLAKLSIETARLWKFKPAREGDHNVPGEFQIHFQFSPQR